MMVMSLQVILMMKIEQLFSKLRVALQNVIKFSELCNNIADKVWQSKKVIQWNVLFMT